MAIADIIVDLKKYFLVPGVCILYMTAGPCMIIINKTIIKDLGFKYPMAVAGMGLLATSTLATILIKLGLVRHDPAVKSQITFWFWLTRIMAVGAGMMTMDECVFPW
jgi:hypothetical protein